MIHSNSIIFTDRSTYCLKQMMSDINKTKPMSDEQEYEHWLRIKEGDVNARNELVVANMRYALKVAKQPFWKHAPLEDRIIAGCEGLIKAAEKFDASLGWRFISYATWYVESEIRNIDKLYMRKRESLEKKIHEDEKESDTILDTLAGSSCFAPDYKIRYEQALDSLRLRVDKRIYGAGKLLKAMYDMGQKGYTTSDFARKYNLNEQQMARLLNIFYEEANLDYSHVA